MKKKILIYFYNGMADFEVSFLIALLATPQYNKEIISISESLDPVKNAYGISFNPQMEISSITNLDDIDALIIPGGVSENNSEEFTTLIRKMDEEGKLLSAICFGPLFLARAGVLESVNYTTTALPEVLEEMKIDNPFNIDNYIESPIVKDKNYITSIGAAFIDFAIEIADYLNLFSGNDEKNQITRLYKNI